MEKKLNFTEVQIKKLNQQALADKYDVSGRYVGRALRGEFNTEEAEAIRKDAAQILKIIENPINNIEVIDPIIVSA